MKPKFKTFSLTMKIVTLYLHRDSSRVEIAKLLGISIDTVGSHLEKAGKISPDIGKKISKQRKRNIEESGTKGHELSIGSQWSWRKR
jgi:predicted DNA-binding protein YlxM (UPF0122 family)